MSERQAARYKRVKRELIYCLWHTEADTIFTVDDGVRFCDLVDHAVTACHRGWSHRCEA